MPSRIEDDCKRSPKVRCNTTLKKPGQDISERDEKQLIDVELSPTCILEVEIPVLGALTVSG